MTTDKWAELRKPFAPEQIGKLPKPYKTDSPRGNCHECGKYHGLPAVHLDYVGHAVLTSRLLSVDPEWTWEPMGVDEQGLPALDRAGNLWIRLTVLGHTRIGVGDGKNAKEAIGDALRNAAMRFGVALDLWAKEDLETAHDEPAPRTETPVTSLPPIAEARARVAQVAQIMKPELTDDERNRWVASEIAKRKLSSTSTADLMALADAWEAS